MTSHDNGRRLMLALAEPRPSRAVRYARAIALGGALGILLCGGVLAVGLALAWISRWAATITIGG